MRTIKTPNVEENEKLYREAFLKLAELKNKLGIKGKNGKNNNAEKLRFIADNYKKLSREEIAKKLKLSVMTIQEYAHRLKLTSLYLNEDEMTFCSLFTKLKGRATDAYSYELWQKNGLKVYKKQGVKVVNLTEFYKWYKTHLRVITLNYYEIGSLSDEPDWFIEKSKADKRAFEYMNKRKWAESEDNRLKNLVSERKTYFEIAKELKRTGSAIKRRCYDLKIPKPKRTPPKQWSKDELGKLKELWLKGYEPCIIAEEIGRSDRKILSMLERYDYFGFPPQKFSIERIDYVGKR